MGDTGQGLPPEPVGVDSLQIPEPGQLGRGEAFAHDAQVCVPDAGAVVLVSK